MLSMGKLRYREAELEDLPQLRELEQQVVDAERPFNPTITPGKTHYYNIKDLICSSDSYLVVCEDRGEIIATGYAQIRESKVSLQHDIHSYLGFMYVAPDWRGKGINKRVLERLKEWSQKKGANNLYLDVYALNTAAIRAYEKAGFDACIMEMKLCL